MTIPNGYKLVLDASYYQQAFDFDKLKPWVSGFIFRSLFGVWKDPKFKEHTSRAVDAGYDRLATYAWMRPDENIKLQLERLGEQLYNSPIKVVAVDVEQHGITHFNFHPFYSPERLSDLAWQYISGLTTMGLVPAIYSRTTWIEAYAKPLWNWIFRYPVWMASYPFAKGRIALTWETLIERYAPKAFSPYLPKNWTASQGVVDAWQWSGDKFLLPGIYKNEAKTAGIAVDLNYVSDTFADMMKIGSFVPPLPEPEHETWLCLAPLGMKVRQTPYASGVDTTIRIRFNEQFKVFWKVQSDGYLWGKLGEGRWTALSWSKKIK